MNCPVCHRRLPASLSICTTCGAMMNDTVREDLRVKISAGGAAAAVALSPMLAPQSSPEPAPGAPLPPVRKKATSDLVSKKTSKTLIAFQSKNSSLPDWRMQLHNAVQRRKEVVSEPIAAPSPEV